MEKDKIFEKVVSWKSLNKEESIYLAENSENKKLKQKILKSNDWFSFEEKLKIVKNLVTKKTADLLKKEIINSKISEEKVDFSLPEDIDENIQDIKIFLETFWAENIEIKKRKTKSWVGYGWDYYSSITPIKIKFNY